MKLRIALISGITGMLFLAQGAYAQEMLAMNTNGEPTATHPSGVTAHSATSGDIPAVIRYTNTGDITVNNYFGLVGMQIFPYMEIQDAGQEFDPQLIAENDMISLDFSARTITYHIDGSAYTFEIETVEQYLNTSDKCLIRSKVEVRVKPRKIGGEKIDTLNIYIDKDNHISFLEVGNTEYYLRP